MLFCEEWVSVVVDGGIGEGGVGEFGEVHVQEGPMTNVQRRKRKGGLEGGMYLIRSNLNQNEMPVQVKDLEQAIRDAFPVSHLQIEDQSSGCGESYSVLLVSEVRTLPFPIDHPVKVHPQAFEGKTTLARHKLSR